MVRAEINREDFLIPSSEDFVSLFGFDVDFDEETHTECYSILDKFSVLIKFWIGTVDRTFSLSVVIDNNEIIRVYDENLQNIKLDEERDLIVIMLGKAGNQQKIDLTVWPRFAVSLSRYRFS